MADPEGQESGESGAQNWRRQLEEERDQFRTELADTKRELSLYQAGLTNLNDDQRTALMSVVGQEADADALKAKAKSLGFVTDAPQEQPQQPQPQAQPQGNPAQEFLQNQAQQFQALDDASSGSPAPQGSGNFMEQLAAAGNDQAKVMEILAQAGMLAER